MYVESAADVLSSLLILLRGPTHLLPSLLVLARLWILAVLHSLLVLMHLSALMLALSCIALALALMLVLLF